MRSSASHCSKFPCPGQYTRNLRCTEIDLPREELDDEQQKKVNILFTEFESLFSKGDDDFGYCPSVEHRIELTDETPFKQRFRRIPPSMLDEVRQHIEQQLAAGIIRRSHSPFSSDVVLVRKKNGQLRICSDYRNLNSRTKKEIIMHCHA